jgi:hypothetical protein
MSERSSHAGFASEAGSDPVAPDELLALTDDEGRLLAPRASPARRVGPLHG